MSGNGSWAIPTYSVTATGTIAADGSVSGTASDSAGQAPTWPTRLATSRANVTRSVYRHQISDTVTRAPAALDQALAAEGEQAPPVGSQ